MSKEIRPLSTSAILGYGFPEASLKAGLDRDPHFIGVDDAETFRRVTATGVLCPALFARLYNVAEEHGLFTRYDAAFAFKATLPRLVPSDDFGDTDVFARQQHAPLLDVDPPI
jgi:hypothetical protein